MTQQEDRISVNEAAILMGYSVDCFRRLFCAPTGPLLVVEEHFGPKGGRRLGVLRASVDGLVHGRIRQPA